MPLKRKGDQILTTMLGVKFLMADGDIEVACRADRELLRNLLEHGSGFGCGCLPAASSDDRASGER